MTLTELSFRVTGCHDISELPTVSYAHRAKLAAVIKQFGAERAPLEQWNTLLTAFGGEPRQTKNEARDALLVLLTEVNSTESKAAAETPSQEAPPVNDEIDTAAVTEVSPAESPPPKKEQSPTLKLILRIWNAITTVLVAMVVILAVLLAGVRIFGLQVFSVLSGSMEPEYHVGALIYVQNVDAFTLQVGDDITFMLDEETVATHRITAILPDETDPSVIRFRTKGIANEQEDGTPVHYKNVVGKPVFTIPYLGYVASYIQQPPGMYIAISLGALLLFLIFLPDVFTEEDSTKKDGKPKKNPKSADAEENKHNAESKAAGVENKEENK